MKVETRKTVEAFAKAAIQDPAERDAVLAALNRPKTERRDKMITGKEAARLAGVTRHTIREWEKLGHLHGKHITPRRVRFSRNELEEFLCEAVEA